MLKSRWTGFAAATALAATPAVAQLVDRTTAPNTANEGIARPFEQQVGAGRGDILTPDSSAYIIARDPFRAVRRGRQVFQRKFTRALGQGPAKGDGAGDLDHVLAIGAGLADSCAACHGRPRGAAGAGGDVATRPDSRDAPHLFGLGLKEMLADEITTDLRAIRSQAVAQAHQQNQAVSRALFSKGIGYGTITALPDGSVVTTGVRGVDPDLRVRPFFLHGGAISIREFVVGAFNAEMGLEAYDSDLKTASAGGRVVTPSGMVLDGALDHIESPPVNSPAEDEDQDGVVNEIPVSVVDFMEFYLLNYFKPGMGQQSVQSQLGLFEMQAMGCTACHAQNLTVEHDRRVADVETRFDPVKGNPFNRLFATASARVHETDDGSGHPTLKTPAGGAFLVRNIFTDFKRHDLGPAFHERNYDGTVRREFLTTPLWGVAGTGPYGHDGRSNTLKDVILRHGGEAQASRDRFAQAHPALQESLIEFLSTLVLFAPDDTASNLNPAAPATAGYPQFGHGSIRLPVLFNNPADPE